MIDNIDSNAMAFIYDNSNNTWANLGTATNINVTLTNGTLTTWPPTWPPTAAELDAAPTDPATHYSAQADEGDQLRQETLRKTIANTQTGKEKRQGATQPTPWSTIYTYAR